MFRSLDTGLFMKNVIFSPIWFFIFLFGCSGGGESSAVPMSNGPEEQSPTLEAATLTSVSTQVGFSGETVVIEGTGFPDRIDDVTVSIGGEEALVLGLFADTLEIELPEVDEPTDALVVEMVGRNVTNHVVNEYSGGILVYPKRRHEWMFFDLTQLPGEFATFTTIVDSLSAYSSVNNNGGGGTIYRTQDGGLTWQNWSSIGFSLRAFHVTSNHEGWASTLPSEVQIIPYEGTDRLDGQVYNFSGADFFISVVYVEDNLENGVVVTLDGYIYVTEDGERFQIARIGDGDLFRARSAYAIDANHMWIGGYNPDNGSAMILYCNGDNLQWHAVSITDPGVKLSNLEDIEFTDPHTGFASVFSAGEPYRLYRTLDGGESWELLSAAPDLSRIAFRDANTGWGISGENIYQTEDGGATWTLVVEHSERFGSIEYIDESVWAIAQSTSARFFLE